MGSHHRRLFDATARAATSFSIVVSISMLQKTTRQRRQLVACPFARSLGSALFSTTSLRRNCHPRNRFCHVPSPVERDVGVAADARMAMDGRLLFRATETTEATGNICLLLGVLLRARIIRIKIKHSRFVDLEHVDALRPKETVVGHPKHDRARNERILGAHFDNGFLLLTRIARGYP